MRSRVSDCVLGYWLPSDVAGADGVDVVMLAGGGGSAPGDMVSGMRPPLPIEPGAYWAKAGTVPARRASAIRNRRMYRIWSSRRRPKVHSQLYEPAALAGRKR